MKVIKFNNKEYACPSSWSEITLRQQLEVKEISDTQQYVKTLGIIAAYCQIPINELRKAETKDVLDIMSNLEFINTLPTALPMFKFTYNDDEYNVSTTLLNNRFEDYVAAQTAIAEYKDNEWKMMAYLVAIMAKKGNETLSDYDINERMEYFLDIDMVTCSSIAGFFLQSLKTSRLISTLSSPQEISKGLRSKQQELEHSLNKLEMLRGKNLLIHWWVMIIRKFINSMIHQLEKSLNSPQSNSLKMRWKKTYKKLLMKKQQKKIGK